MKAGFRAEANLEVGTVKFGLDVLRDGPAQISIDNYRLTIRQAELEIYFGFQESLDNLSEEEKAFRWDVDLTSLRRLSSAIPSNIAALEKQYEILSDEVTEMVFLITGRTNYQSPREMALLERDVSKLATPMGREFREISRKHKEIASQLPEINLEIEGDVLTFCLTLSESASTCTACVTLTAKPDCEEVPGKLPYYKGDDTLNIVEWFGIKPVQLINQGHPQGEKGPISYNPGPIDVR